MPIEIKELHIKITVDTAKTGQGSEYRQAAAGNMNPGGDLAKDSIIAECVEQVLQVIHSKEER